MILKFIGGPDDGRTVEIDADELERSSFVMVAAPILPFREPLPDHPPKISPSQKNGIARYRKGEIGDLIFDGYE